MAGNKKSGNRSIVNRLPADSADRVFKFAAKGKRSIEIAAYFDICKRGFYRWLQVGKQDLSEGKETPYSKFVIAYQEGRQEYKREQIAKVEEAHYNAALGKNTITEIRETLDKDGKPQAGMSERVTKQIAPSVQAQMHILSKQDKEEWGDTGTHSTITHIGVNAPAITADEWVNKYAKPIVVDAKVVPDAPKE